MEAPIEASLVVTAPGGTVDTRTMQRTATLTDTFNPPSLITMTDQVALRASRRPGHNPLTSGIYMLGFCQQIGLNLLKQEKTAKGGLKAKRLQCG